MQGSLAVPLPRKPAPQTALLGTAPRPEAQEVKFMPRAA